MGIQEKEVKRRIRVGKIEKAILNTLVDAGTIGVALVAPNALRMFKKRGSIGKTESRRVNRSLRLLQEKGLIEIAKTSKGKVVRLTGKGELVLLRIGSRGYQLRKPKHWDGKWRIVIFDISEQHKRLRERVRDLLLQIGFVRLQNSVWVYPYDCEDLLILIKADFKIGKDVLYIIADSIENDAWLKKRFSL